MKSVESNPEKNTLPSDTSDDSKNSMQSYKDSSSSGFKMFLEKNLKRAI